MHRNKRKRLLRHGTVHRCSEEEGWLVDCFVWCCFFFWFCLFVLFGLFVCLFCLVSWTSSNLAWQRNLALQRRHRTACMNRSISSATRMAVDRRAAAVRPHHWRPAAAARSHRSPDHSAALRTANHTHKHMKEFWVDGFWTGGCGCFFGVCVVGFVFGHDEVGWKLYVVCIECCVCFLVWWRRRNGRLADLQLYLLCWCCRWVRQQQV